MRDKGSFHLNGAREIREAMNNLPGGVNRRAAKTGARKAAMEFTRELKSSAPRGETGQLKKSWGYKLSKRSTKSTNVGYFVYLKKNWFYQVLDLPENDDPEQGMTNPYFVQTFDRSKQQLAARMISGTKAALLVEVGKLYAKTKYLSQKKR